MIAQYRVLAKIHLRARKVLKQLRYGSVHYPADLLNLARKVDEASERRKAERAQAKEPRT